MEELREYIVGYEGLYQVSDLGNVRSLNYNHTGKIINLKHGIDQKGYCLVGLSKNGRLKTHKVSRLVGKMFHPNPDNLPVVLHLNNIKTDNRAVNLKRGTYLENSQQAYSDGLVKLPRLGKFGKEHNRSKKVLQYTLDGKLIRERDGLMCIQRELGYLNGCVSSCCLGQRKRMYGFIWKFKTDEKNLVR